MKTLPYFRWFPADAETDENYTALSNEELGFFHRCLNRSWINSGLPSDLQKLAQTMGVTQKYLDRIWPAVSKCFVLTDTVHPRLVNPRQEKERDLALAKTRQASNAVAVRERKRIERSSADPSPDASPDQSDDHPRAYVSVSDSVSVSGKIQHGQTKTLAVDSSGPASGRFDEWWELWRKVRGSHHKLAACQAFMSVVTQDLESECFECTRSYLASLRDPAHGYNPDNFLFVQAREAFASRWIPRQKSKSELTAEFWEREEREAEEADRRRQNAAD